MNIFNIEYGTHRSLPAMIDYITDMDGHANEHTTMPIPYITGFGLDPYRPAQDMLALQQYYGKSLHRPYWHFEVSLENISYNNISQAIFYYIGQETYVWSGCQLIMAVHTNTYHKNGCIHCHYVLNSVCCNGNKLNLNSYGARTKLEDIINKILGQYKLSPVNTHRNKQPQTLLAG